MPLTDWILIGCIILLFVIFVGSFWEFIKIEIDYRKYLKGERHEQRF
jgi:hypothetical protein